MTDILFGLYITMGLSILFTFTYFLLIKKYDERIDVPPPLYNVSTNQTTTKEN